MNKLDTDAIRMHVRARQFEIKAQTGISWRGKSLLLKHAADRLYGLCHDATLCEIAQMLDEQRDDKVSSDISKSRSKILVGKELEDAWDSQLISVYWFLMG